MAAAFALPACIIPHCQLACVIAIFLCHNFNWLGVAFKIKDAPDNYLFYYVSKASPINCFLFLTLEFLINYASQSIGNCSKVFVRLSQDL